MRLGDKVTFITGAASGQGRVAAVEFAREGSKVAIMDVDGSGLARTAELVREIGGEVVAIEGSVASAEDVQGAIRRAVDAFGRLNVLYSNAGIYWPGRDGPVTELPEDIWDTVINTNLKGMYLCAKYAVPQIIKAGGGSVINVASVAGTNGSPRAHAYGASKGGVIALTKSMAASYGHDNVRVNAIAPGAIDTPMTRPLWNESQQTLMAQRTPLGRVGQPEDVVRLAIYLASDESAWMTGGVHIIDGGLTLL